MVPASRDGREGPCEMQAPGKHPGSGAGRVCVVIVICLSIISLVFGNNQVLLFIGPSLRFLLKCNMMLKK